MGGPLTSRIYLGSVALWTSLWGVGSFPGRGDWGINGQARPAREHLSDRRAPTLRRCRASKLGHQGRQAGA